MTSQAKCAIHFSTGSGTLPGVTRGLKSEVDTAEQKAPVRLRNLEELIRSLGQLKPGKTLNCPEEYERRWAEVLSGEREELDPRIVRYLCWHAQIATSEAFQRFLDRTREPIAARSLLGLVRSCHARWSKDFSDGHVPSTVRGRLKLYDGPNRLLQKWNQSAAMMLGPSGHALFAREIVCNLDGLANLVDTWGLGGEPSRYLSLSVAAASYVCLEQLDRSPALCELLIQELVPWSGWLPGDLKHIVGQLILEVSRDKGDLIDVITKLFLADSRFGDPRLPGNELNWAGMDAAARRFKEWLSAEDISFFFEHVLPRGTDPHGRKKFWLRYVGGRGLVSRPLLNDSDRFRLRQVLKERKAQVTHFGNLRADTSAFLLDFGPVLVIEFSKVGNACYVYEKSAAADIVPDFWTSIAFTISGLKHKDQIATGIPVRHDAQGRWKEDMEQILAQYGVRSVS